MIYTSYFAKYRGDKGVAITRYTPKFWTGETCQDLAPSENLLRWWKSLSKQEQQATGNIVKFTKCFLFETLNNLDAKELAKKLDGKVLLCYEKPEDFCHREVVAGWFKSRGYDCEELNYDNN